MDAWELYHQAHSQLSLKGWGKETFEESIHLLREAIALDPGFALAHAYLSLLLAVREGLVIDSLSVDIEMDFAEGASLGFGEDSAAPLETRLFIRIDTDSLESEVVALVDRALEKDTFFLALRDAQSVKTDVSVID